MPANQHRRGTTLQTINVTVNGETYEENVDERLILVDFLRERLALTGTHVGCTYEGVCGACTVHLDGEAVKSCLLLAVQADGHAVTTVEDWVSAASCHRCSRPSPIITRCSAATARRGS